jgi:hypothetical protein
MCQVSDVDELNANLDIISDDFKVSWGYVVDGYIDMMLSVSLCDWFGLGFGVQMANTDMLLFRVSKITNSNTGLESYVVEVHDMWSTGNVIPDDDYMRGGANDWQMLGYIYSNHHIIVQQ